MLESEEKVLLGGAFHYFRIPCDAWEKSIKKLADVLDFLDLYIPWGWHEPEEGKFDFEGRTHPMRDLKTVMELILRYKLRVSVRPGPVIFAEYRYFGYPKWLFKYKEILQKDVYGHTWKFAPNFNHPVYLEKANRWIKKVLEFLSQYDAAIIGYQIDNETGLLLADSFISPTPTIRDASPLTRKMFLEKTGKEFPRPRLGWKLRGEFHNFAEMMEVQDFMEWWVVQYLKNLRENGFREIPDSKLFLNDAAQLMPPANSTRKISVAPVYFDLYPKVSSSREVFDQPFLSCYASKFYASFSEVASAECQCGWFDPNVKVSNDETLQLVMDLYAHGARMISLYVAQDCIEDDGTKYIWNALLNPYGEENPRMSVARKIRKFLDEWGEFLIRSDEVHDNKIAIIEHAPVHRVSGSDSFIYAAQFMTAMGMVGILEEMGHNPRILLLERVSVEDLMRYHVLLFPSNYFMSRKDAKKLEEYVRRGGTVVFSPYVPWKALDGTPLDVSFARKYSARDIHGVSIRFLHIVATIIKWWLWKRWKLFQRKPFKLRTWQLYTLDATQLSIPPLMAIFGKSISARYRMGDKWCKVGIAPLTLKYDVPENEVILKKGRLKIGYVQRIGKGKIIALGFPLASQYAVNRYYHLDEKTLELKRMLAEFTGIDNRGIRSVEIIKRTDGKTTLTFYINRGDAKEITLDHEGELVFRGKQSRVSKGKLFLDAHDVVVIRGGGMV